MAQYIDGQSISVPSFCKAKTSKNNSEALLRCKGCLVDFSRRSHKVNTSRGIRVSPSETSICAARRDILLLSAAAACHSLQLRSPVADRCTFSAQTKNQSQACIQDVNDVCCGVGSSRPVYCNRGPNADCCPVRGNGALSQWYATQPYEQAWIDKAAVCAKVADLQLCKARDTLCKPKPRGAYDIARSTLHALSR